MLHCIVFHLIAQERTILNVMFIQVNVHVFIQEHKDFVNVTLDGMAFGSDAVHLQVFHDFLQLNCMVFIRSLLEDVPYQEGFEFLSWLFSTLFLLFFHVDNSF